MRRGMDEQGKRDSRIIGVRRVRQDADLGSQAVLSDLHQRRINSNSGGA